MERKKWSPFSPSNFRPERVLELAAELVERGQLVAVLEAQARGARVAREEPGDVLGVGERRVVQQHAAEELGEALAGLVGEVARGGDVRPEGGLARWRGGRTPSSRTPVPSAARPTSTKSRRLVTSTRP